MTHVAKSAAQKFSPKSVRKKNKASVAVMKVYPSELVIIKLIRFLFKVPLDKCLKAIGDKTYNGS